MIMDIVMRRALAAAMVVGPYAFCRIMAIPPDEGYLSDILIYVYALNPLIMAARRNASGKAGPENCATCPVRANMPAPIMTPVPMATVPARLSDPFS